jgi:hypothetical protein
MERPVLLGVAAERIDIGARRQQSCNGAGRSEAGGEMKSRPSIRREFENETGPGGEDGLKIWEIACCRGLKYVKGNRLGSACSEQRRAQGRPAAVNRPEQRRDALRVARARESGVGREGIGELRRCVALNQFEDCCCFCNSSLLLTAKSWAV